MQGLVGASVLVSMMMCGAGAGAAPGPIVAAAVAETAPVAAAATEDAADDPAIWVHPEDPSLSLIIGTDKTSGLGVYDLSGALLQFLPDGRMNNVDVRSGVLLGGAPVHVAAASNRTDNTIALYRIDPESRRLTRCAAPIETGLPEIYGLCMHRSARTGAHDVFVNDKSGTVQQWRLRDAGGALGADLVRTFEVGGQVEGMVADDEAGVVFIGEEHAGIWRYPVEPDDELERTLVDAIKPIGNVAADVEGLAIVRGDGPGAGAGAGWLLASGQDDDEISVYERRPPHRFVTWVKVWASDSIDGVTHTDGIDAVGTPRGPAFPGGLLVMQDDENPGAGQNFKLVSWGWIEERLEAAGRPATP